MKFNRVAMKFNHVAMKFIRVPLNFKRVRMNFKRVPLDLSGTVLSGLGPDPKRKHQRVHVWALMELS